MRRSRGDAVLRLCATLVPALFFFVAVLFRGEDWVDGAADEGFAEDGVDA
jgi:hypothetical protein